MKKLSIAVLIFCLALLPEVASAQVKPLARPTPVPTPAPVPTASLVSAKEVKGSFRVKWDGKYIPGVQSVGALRRKTEVVEHRGGGDASLARRAPGKTEHQALVLKRPRSSDSEFERWANKVWSFGTGLGSEVSLRDFRKDLMIELRDAKDKVVMLFKVYRCWPSEYVALTDLDADNPSGMEALVIEYEGFERDYSVR
jgi:phage tail-like protein